MTKYEFSDGLRRALTGKLPPDRVNEHIRYYEGYIDTEIRKGRSEQEVMESLGDPRLIAKTLLVGTSSDSTPMGGTVESSCYDDGTGSERCGDTPEVHSIRITGLPIIIGFIILIILVIALFIRLLPIIIVAGFIAWLISRIRGRRL